MEKSIAITLDEFKQNLVKTISTSNLPVVIVDLVLKDLYGEIHNLAIETTQNDKREYEQSYESI